MTNISYIIEHMEDDEQATNSIPPWVNLEYAHMRTLAGPDADIHFTHLSKSSVNHLSSTVHHAKTHFHQIGVVDFLKQVRDDNDEVANLDRVCLLDPKSPQELSPEDGDGRFNFFLFGGILGDDPPRDRTAELRVLGFPTRHLGPVQMTTDTALGVTKRVVVDKVPLNSIPYVDFPTITFNPKESVEMPFRYIASEGNTPVLPPGMKELLHEDLNKAFEF